jgi:hypothetical protein
MIRNPIGLGIVMVVVGIILAVFGFIEHRMAAASSKQPEEISLQKLIERGPAGNPNIILTDYELCPNFVYKTKNRVWNAAWVPAVPRNAARQGPAGRPAVVQALIFTINARDQGSLYQLCQQPRLSALVTNEIMSMGGEEKRLLEESYPGTDFSRCLIIQQGREPAGPVKLLLMVGGGIFLAVSGLGLAVFKLYQLNRDPPSNTRKQRWLRKAAEEDEDTRPRKRRIVRQDDNDEPRKRKTVQEDDNDEPRPRRTRGIRRAEEE